MNTTKKTPGQIAFEAHKEARTDWIGQVDWDHQCESNRNAFEAAALAVLTSQWQLGPRPDFTRCFTQRGANGEGYWMPIPPLPPTKQELEIAEFDAWWSAQPMRTGKHRAECLEAWQAARATAEPNT